MLEKVELEGVKDEKIIEQGSVNLLIADPWRWLGTGKEVQGLAKDKRDKYIKKMQKELLAAYDCLADKPHGGNMLIGVNLFSMSSFGENIFEKDLIKRALLWRKDVEVPEAQTEYVDGTRWFLWGIKDRGWKFNLLGNEMYFDSCFYSVGHDPLKVAKDIVKRFSDEGDTVMVLNDYKGSVLKEAIESTGRVYVSAIHKDGVMVHA